MNPQCWPCLNWHWIVVGFMNILAVIIFLLLLPGIQVCAQEPLTGTRLGSAGTANPITVIRLQQPDEVSEIERLLLSDRTDEALARALRYVEQVNQSAMDAQSRYFAHNALCVVYTKLGKHAEAEAECNAAIEAMPGHWSAWSNRGTLRYLAADFEGAKQDYQRAMERAGNQQAVIDLLRHNLTLVDLNLLPQEQQ